MQADLKTAGHANTPIYVGELGSVSYNPGKQTSSITQALFAGQALGEMMKAGISRATWWLAYGGCADPNSGNFNADLYGWQNFGGYMVFSDGTPEYGCSNATQTALGTMLPTSRAYQLFSTVAKTGQHALAASVGGDTADLRAYALTQKGGAALVLFNVNETNTVSVTITVTGVARASKVTVNTYDKSIYDESQNNVWAGADLGEAGQAGVAGDDHADALEHERGADFGMSARGWHGGLSWTPQSLLRLFEAGQGRPARSWSLSLTGGLSCWRHRLCSWSMRLC